VPLLIAKKDLFTRRVLKDANTLLEDKLDSLVK
jgi:hypothetical protein